ncbi:MAG: hypothetical protein SPL12_05445 [Bacteroidales bacterium]|nr:hypothetical protein [Bacteroidales bacterium]
MTHGKSNSILTAIFTAVFCLTIPAITMGQDDIVGRAQTDTIPKLKAAPAIEKTFVFVDSDCGCLLPYYPDVEYVWTPRRFVKLPQLPSSVYEQYTSDKTLYEDRRLPPLVEIEDVDGIKIIKKETANDTREEHLQPAQRGPQAHCGGK